MGKGNNIFRFKQFECRHYDSSMRIGVDAILLGAWADVSGNRILDVGTGCGVIALMCAQRNDRCVIDAIDIHEPSKREAECNFQSSPWSERLHARLCDFRTLSATEKYDRIISNPPYFSSGVNPGSSARMCARHEGGLSPLSLLQHGDKILADDGRIAMVIPYLRAEEIIADARAAEWYLARRMDVRGNEHAEFKRSLIEMTRKQHVLELSTLTLETSPGVPTDAHRDLCRDFYLYF